MTVIDLGDARPETSGGKAAALGGLVRSGMPVPSGFVVPTSEYLRHVGRADGSLVDPERILGLELADDLVAAIDGALRRLTGAGGTGRVAVRSSATSEDSIGASAAGQHESVLAVRGTDAVCEAILRCWASLWSPHAVAYRGHRRPCSGSSPEMAILVQEFIDADTSGVLFTGSVRMLEATRGLGDQLAGGQVTPDAWQIDDTGITELRTAERTEPSARHEEGLRPRQVPRRQHAAPSLRDEQVHALDELGRRVTRELGAPADIEWALTGQQIHILQARPITAAPPQPQSQPQRAPQKGSGGTALHGVPASAGIATGTVRLVAGPADFRRGGPGDVLVCQHTDPAWTPLFQIAAAVVTEIGGVLSHAAIVAREVGIPAVLAVPEARRTLPEGTIVTVDGDAGSIRLGRPG